MSDRVKEQTFILTSWIKELQKQLIIKRDRTTQEKLLTAFESFQFPEDDKWGDVECFVGGEVCFGHFIGSHSFRPVRVCL
jgi:hypothetical protein